MTQLVVTTNANEDLSDIEAYVSRDNPRAALRLTARLREAFLNIVRTPDQLRPKLGRTTRLFPVGSYVIVYDYDPVARRVVVLRVVHGARDLPRLLRS